VSSDDVAKAFFHHVGTGMIDAVRAALDAAPQLINAVGPHPFWGGRPQALHVSIESDRREIFDLLLERGADVNGRNDQYDHWSPLMLTIQRGRRGMSDELLLRGARVGLFESLMLGDDARVDELLDREGLPAIVPNGGSPLAFARTTHAIDRLLDLGASIDAKDRWGSSPIDTMNSMPLVRHLIARGAAASPRDYARLGDVDTLERLYEDDPSIARLDSVMLAAVDGSQYELVEWLLARGANPNARADAQSRQTALHTAAWNGDLRMVQLLVAAGADPSLHDEEHDTTPQHWAEVAHDIANNAKCAAVAEFLRQ
jgi:ankyrin repeat protein